MRRKFINMSCYSCLFRNQNISQKISENQNIQIHYNPNEFEYKYNIYSFNKNEFIMFEDYYNIFYQNTNKPTRTKIWQSWG